VQQTRTFYDALFTACKENALKKVLKRYFCNTANALREKSGGHYPLSVIPDESNGEDFQDQKGIGPWRRASLDTFDPSAELQKISFGRATWSRAESGLSFLARQRPLMYRGVDLAQSRCDRKPQV
jgi:hypothetical protein